MNNQVELQDDEEFADLNGEQVENQPRQERVQAQQEDDDLPDKYRGKSPKGDC